MTEEELFDALLEEVFDEALARKIESHLEHLYRMEWRKTAQSDEEKKLEKRTKKELLMALLKEGFNEELTKEMKIQLELLERD